MDEEKQTIWWESSNQEQSSPKSAKRRKRSPFLVAAGFLAVVGTMVGLLATSPDPTAPYKSEFDSTIYPATALETVGQCGGTFTFDVPSAFSGKIPEEFFDNPNGPGKVARTVPDDPMIVPAYGYFIQPKSDPETNFLASNEVDIVPESMEYLGYMWDGWSIIWYSPDIDGSAEAAIKRYVDGSSDKVIAMPWNEPQGRTLPLNRSIGFSSWGMTMSCGLWDDRIADKFVDSAQTNTAERNIEDPHSAPIDKRGELLQINVQQWDDSDKK